jgi:flagellar motor switch protein FliN/FliY
MTDTAPRTTLTGVTGDPGTEPGTAAPSVAPFEPAPAPAPATAPALPMEALHDVELNVEVILGRARMPLRDLLAARPRTTIELDRPVRSPVDVMVNGTLFARGEMVVVGDSEIGVQITEVVGSDSAGPGNDQA